MSDPVGYLKHLDLQPDDTTNIDSSLHKTCFQSSMVQSLYFLLKAMQSHMFFALRWRTLAQLWYCKSLRKLSEIRLTDTSLSSARLFSFSFQAVSVGFLSSCLLITLEVPFDILGLPEQCLGVGKISPPPVAKFLGPLLNLPRSYSHTSGCIFTLLNLLVEGYNNNNCISFQLFTTYHHRDIKAWTQRPTQENDHSMWEMFTQSPRAP